MVFVSIHSLGDRSKMIDEVGTLICLSRCNVIECIQYIRCYLIRYR